MTSTTQKRNLETEMDLKDNILLNFWVQLLISLLIGGLVVGVLAYQSGGKMTASGKDYLDSNSPGLIGKVIYILDQRSLRA